jgi:peptidoglycan/LPS O-acetylase OafA/YrhL
MGYVKEHWKYLTGAGGYPGIDFLRALAVLLVAFYHFQMLPMGWVGVDIFFVISGFLIGGIILDKVKSGSFDFVDFYKKRALRILPIYYFIMLLCFIFKAGGVFDFAGIKSILSGMLFLQTTGPYFFPGFFTVNDAYIPAGSWSLVIEEMFYLVAPLAIVLVSYLAGKRLWFIIAVLVVAFVSGIATRIAMTSAFMPDDSSWHFASFIQFHSRYDELAIGVLAAAYLRFARDVKAQSAWWIAAALTLIFLFLMYIFGKPEFLAKPFLMTRDTIWLPTLLGAIGACLVLGIYWMPLQAKPIVLLARLSYPLYLVHIFFLEMTNRYSHVGILKWMLEAFTHHGRSVVLIAVCVFLSYLASLLVEYPFIRIYKTKKAPATIDSKPEAVAA